jgi:NADH-quinone oxidoreductase subunit L
MLLRFMEIILLPLALLGLLGGVINLPGYLGGGWLEGFFTRAAPGEAAGIGHTPELLLQLAAAVVALAGTAAAHLRYGGERRRLRIAAAAEAPSGITAFLLAGWRFDDLYRLLFIRPYEALAGFFWTRVDEGVIDDSLDGLANLLGATGERLGGWTTGRVSVYLLSMAAGLALLLGYLAWNLL